MKQEEKNLIFELNVQSQTITTYTQYQNKLLMKLLAYFQADIKDAISQQRKEGVNYVVFTAEEQQSGLRHRSVPLAYLEPHKGHYNRAKLALQDMAKKEMWIPVYKKKGLMQFATAKPLFAVDFEIRQSRTFVNLHFCVETLKYYLSNQQGYHSINLDKLFSFKRNATRQMYRLYLGKFALGYTTIRCGGLAQLIGCGKQYKNLKSIKADLLEPARREMKQAFYKNQCDIHFDYSLSRNQDSQACEKSYLKKLIFTFYTAEDEHLSANRQAQLTDYQTRLWFQLKNTWGVKDEVARNICLRIKIWMLQELDDLMIRKRWFADKLKAEKKPLANPAGYIVKGIGAFLDEKEQMAQQEGKSKPECPNAPTPPHFKKENDENT